MPRAKARTGRDIQRVEEEVAERLGTTVEIKSGKKGSGRLVVHYMSHEHLDELLEKLTR
jgi:ParB family chromosome partitioning protein